MKKRRKRKKEKVEDGEDYFGSSHPKNMPPHFFLGSVHMSYHTAKRAAVQNQDFTVAPRHWYIDADFRCDTCKTVFTWSADEQRVWFEKYRFYVDAQPRHCPKCRALHRRLAKLRRDYDATVGAARDHGRESEKLRIIEILNELENALTNLPDKMRETRQLFELQTGTKADQEE